jgi:hypothetical protein
MAGKFHVNNAGEAGQCRATQGGCPFGGDAQHYDNPDSARKAFELSMAASQLPEASKKTVAIELTPEEQYSPEKYGGFTYKEVVFDDKARRARWVHFYKQNARTSRTTMEGVDEAASSSFWREKRDWENMARTEPARSFELNVPIRLVPSGSEVLIGYSWDQSSRLVGVPVDNGDGHVVGKYRDIANEWDYVEQNTSFDLARVPSDKKVSPRWFAANTKAANLKAAREQYLKDTEDASKVTKPRSKK